MKCLRSGLAGQLDITHGVPAEELIDDDWHPTKQGLDRVLECYEECLGGSD